MKTPSMKIFLTEEYKGDKKKCLEVMNDIRTVRFKDIVKSSMIYFDPNDTLQEDNHFVKEYKDFIQSSSSCNNGGQLAPWVLRMIFNKEAFLQYHITMIGLHQKLMEYYSDNISCMFSDDNTKDELIFRLKLSTNGNNPDDMLTELKALEHNILENIIIKGTENIERVSLLPDETKKKVSDYNPITRKFESKEEWFVVTDGTNFEKVLCNPIVDKVRTTTNNVIEIYETLGIEAVRQALFNEISEVLDTIHVDYRHIAMLVDVQTNKGYILSIDRHGINRGDIGPLAKCSFEETTDKLIKAGVFAEYDKINGVSANVMLGQVAPAGTGDCEILIDQEKLDNISTDRANENDNMYYTDDNDHENVCEPDTFRIVFHPPVINKNKKLVRIPNF